MNPSDFYIGDEPDRAKLVVRVIEMKTRASLSQANGITNYALPAAAFTSNRIYESDVNENTDLGQFLDIGKVYTKIYKPSYKYGLDSGLEAKKKHGHQDNVFFEGSGLFERKTQHTPEQLSQSFGPDNLIEKRGGASKVEFGVRDEAMNKIKYSQTSLFVK